MFGHQDDQAAQDSNHIPDQAIDAALSEQQLPAPQTDQSWGHPGQPLDDGQPVITPTVPQAAPAVPTTATPTVPVTDGDTNDLIDIKQQALSQLSPLVSHLEQSPEEKFRTLMMMIQASDDKTKIKDAYDAAKQIADEKERAQALLDVINEINYFTQHLEN